jgi:hypothetical protein
MSSEQHELGLGFEVSMNQERTLLRVAFVINGEMQNHIIIPVDEWAGLSKGVEHLLEMGR